VGELLLLSNSTAPGMGFLEHATEAIRAVLSGRRSLLFVPFATSDPDAYTSVMRRALARVGIEVTSLHQARDLIAAVADAEAVFVGGGNSFRLLRALTTLGVLEALRQAADTGVPYLASSAGANLACPTIRTTNDMPIVEPGSLSALGLIPFQLNPHYLDPDPRSPHQGETRPKRIEEFLEETTSPSWACVKAPGWRSPGRGHTCPVATPAACSAGMPTPSTSRSARTCPICSRPPRASTLAQRFSRRAGAAPTAGPARPGIAAQRSPLPTKNRPEIARTTCRVGEGRA
jgi:dipeptidase E